MYTKQKQKFEQGQAVSMAYLLFPFSACASPPISFVSFRVTDVAFTVLLKDIIQLCTSSS